MFSSSAPSLSATFLFTRSALAGGLIALAGCAQPQTPGFYDPQRGSSITDSQYTGEGAQYRNVVRAPSQLQISLDRDARQAGAPAASVSVAGNPVGANPTAGTPAGDAQTGAADAPVRGQATTASAVQDRPGATATGGATGTAAANPALAGFAPQAQTYAGTLPCLAPGMNCSGQRMVLTLAPNGRWRARLAFLDATGAPGKPVVEQGCWDATTARPIRVLLTDRQGNTRADFESINNALIIRSMDGQTPNLNYSLTRQPDLDAIDELSSSAAPNCG